MNGGRWMNGSLMGFLSNGGPLQSLSKSISFWCLHWQTLPLSLQQNGRKLTSVCFIITNEPLGQKPDDQSCNESWNRKNKDKSQDFMPVYIRCHFMPVTKPTFCYLKLPFLWLVNSLTWHNLLTYIAKHLLFTCIAGIFLLCGTYFWFRRLPQYTDEQKKPNKKQA